ARQPGERLLDAVAHLFRLAARGSDQTCRKAFLIVDENFQKMLGRELLVVRAQGEPLRGLHETTRPLGEFLRVHFTSQALATVASRPAGTSPMNFRIRPLMGAFPSRYLGLKSFGFKRRAAVFSALQPGFRRAATGASCWPRRA